MAKYSKKLDRTKRTVLFVKFMQWLGLMCFFIFGIALLLMLLFVPTRMYSMLMYPGLLIIFGFVIIPYICRIIVLLTIQIGFSQTYFWIKYTFLFGLLYLATFAFFIWRINKKYVSVIKETIDCMKNTCAPCMMEKCGPTCMPCIEKLPFISKAIVPQV